MATDFLATDFAAFMAETAAPMTAALGALDEASKGGAGSGNWGHRGRPGEVGGSAAGSGSKPAGTAGDASAWTPARLAALRLEDPQRAPVGEAALTQAVAHLQAPRRKTYQWAGESETAIRAFFKASAEGSGTWGKQVQLRREPLDNYADGSTLDRFRFRAGNVRVEAYRLQRGYDYLVVTGTVPAGA